MATVFLGYRRLLVTDYLHPGKTTTGQYYEEPVLGKIIFEMISNKSK